VFLLVRQSIKVDLLCLVVNIIVFFVDNGVLVEFVVYVYTYIVLTMY